MSLLVLFTFFAIFVVVLFLFAFKKPRETPGYTGGEIIPPSKIPHTNFYQTFYRLFPRTYRWLEKVHGGDLDSYIYLLLLTTALLFLLTMLPGWF